MSFVCHVLSLIVGLFNYCEADSRSQTLIPTDSVLFLFLYFYPIYFEQVITEDNNQYAETKKNLRKTIKELRDTVSKFYYIFVCLSLN